MINTDENIESASKTTKNILKELSETLKSNINSLKRRTGHLRETYMLQERNDVEELSKLKKTLESMKETNQMLMNKHRNIKEAIEEDLVEHKKMEDRYQHVEIQLKDLQTAYSVNMITEQELTEKLSMIQAKYQILKNKYETKKNQQLAINHNFKIFLGLDIFSMRENTLKIVFNNMGAECNVIIDFDKKESVSQCVPELNLERLNFIFKEGMDFYKFIKIIRDEIKRKL